jgi:inner membrane protein
MLMSRSLALKLGAIAVLTALLLLALARIESLVGERQALRDSVVQDIARSSTYQQQLTGPILIVPYIRTQRAWIEDPESRQKRFAETTLAGELRFLPQTLRIEGRVTTQIRHRGIYQARLYHADLHLLADFEVPANEGIETDLEAYRFGKPFVAVGVTDIRGIDRVSARDGSGTAIEFEPGTGTSLLSAGVHAPLENAAAAGRVELSLDVSLAGTGQLQLTPVGRQTHVELTSNWRNPSFVGEYLPQKYELSERGFSALWETSFFATNLEELLRKCTASQECEQLMGRHFGVTFADPVDQYLQTDRAIKYALLFIFLTFVSFFLYEVGRRLAIHAIQYALVGAALAVFYLLLLSLSEHIGFTPAYVISACACVTLIGFYVCNALRSVSHGLGFTAALGALYALLYAVLGAEDYALLAGSLLLFGLLATLMILTRRINWFELEAGTQS